MQMEVRNNSCNIEAPRQFSTMQMNYPDTQLFSEELIIPQRNLMSSDSVGSMVPLEFFVGKWR